MATTRISIPFAVDLTKEAGWNKASGQKHTYWIVRAHIHLRERQVDETIKMGNKLAALESPKGVSQENVIAIETEHTSVQFRESFQESMRQDESLQEFVSTLAAGLGSSETGKMSSEFKSRVQQKLVNSFKQSFRVREVITKRVKETYQLTQRVDPSITGRLVAVAAYQKYVYDLYLTWIDHLHVCYRKTALGLRKKRTKHPAPLSPMHPNWIRFNIPLAAVKCWKVLPKSSLIVSECDYINEVRDPEEIEILAPEYPHYNGATKPDVPTLYQLSNVAFPLKWVKRKGDWTEEELKKIEEEEAVGTAWFWQYGPGKDQQEPHAI